MRFKDIWESIPEEYHVRCYAFIADLTGCSKSFGLAPLIPLWFDELTEDQQRLLIFCRNMYYLEVYHESRSKKG